MIKKNALAVLSIFLCAIITLYSYAGSRMAKRYHLHEAAEAGDLARVALMLDQGFKVYARDRNNETPVYAAAKSGHIAVVKLLISRDAKVSARGTNDQIPLHYACHQGNSDTVRLLINHKARLGAINQDGKTPLHVAAESGHALIVEILLNHRPKIINIETSYWELAPLHYACKHGHIHFAQLLLEKNAKKNHRDKNGYTPLYYAACQGHFDVCVMLCEASDLDKSLHVICGTPSGAHIQGLIEHLLSKDADSNSMDNNFQSPLHVAAKNGNLLAVKALVSAGAQLNARDKDQRTPLHVAASSCHSEVIAYLLWQNAETDLIDKKKMTPLTCALENRQAIRNYHIFPVQARKSLITSIKAIYHFINVGVYCNKNEQKWLDIFTPRYKTWIEMRKKKLAKVLEDTYVETLPRYLQSLLLKFVVSQTEKKQTRENSSSDGVFSTKKTKLN